MSEHEHAWYTGALDADDPIVTICMHCGEYDEHRPVETGRALRRNGHKTCANCGQKIWHRSGGTIRPGQWLLA